MMPGRNAAYMPRHGESTCNYTRKKIQTDRLERGDTMRGQVKIDMTPREHKSLAFLFVREMQNNTHCALDWKAREQMEQIIADVIFERYRADIRQFERRLNALIMTAEIYAYPDDIQSDIKRIRKRIWAHLSQVRTEYYENN